MSPRGRPSARPCTSASAPRRRRRRSARRASSPSPSPPPPDPAPGEPFLPETRGVLASETNGVTAAEPPVAGAGLRLSLDPTTPARGVRRGRRVAGRDRERRRSAGDVPIRGAPVSSRRRRRRRFPEGESSLSAGIAAPSPAYAPGVSLEALVREKDDDLAAALALGARTGRWVPLAAAGGGARTGNGSKNDDAAAGTDAPSSSAQAAVVVSAAEELGDGEEHPVTWKQIKTWFENRRMTQKRIKEGNARPAAPRRRRRRRRRRREERTRAPREPPRPPALKNRAAPDAGGSKKRVSLGPAAGAPVPRRDATRRDGAARREARATDASSAPAALRLPARRSLDLDRSLGPARRQPPPPPLRTCARATRAGASRLRADPRDVVGGHPRRAGRRGARARPDEDQTVCDFFRSTELSRVSEESGRAFSWERETPPYARRP